MFLDLSFISSYYYSTSTRQLKPSRHWSLYRARWLAWFRLFVLRSLADAPKKFFGHTPFRRLPLHQSNSRVCVRSTISFTSNKRNRMTNHRPNKKTATNPSLHNPSKPSIPILPVSISVLPKSMLQSRRIEMLNRSKSLPALLAISMN